MSAPAVISVDPKAEWLTKAEHAIATLVTRYHRDGRTFTADDVHKIAGDPDVANWKGGAFLAASARGEIVKTHMYRPSKRPERKGSILAVWRAAT